VGRKGLPVSGWVVLDKPAGLGSTPAVALVRRAFGAAKAGHAGTLDPAATGVLAVALGEATKTVPFLESAPKGYRFMVRWGAETATDDAGGSILRTSPLRPSPAAILAALPAFRGDILQVPPQVSAVKVDGARAYDLAREGVQMDLAARPLRVDRLDLLGTPDAGHALLEMHCGKGGYVRSIARDLGQALGCLGHVLWLRREWSGPFRAADGWAPDEITRRAGTPGLAKCLRPLEDALFALPRHDVDAAAAARLRLGAAVPAVGPDGAAWAALDGRAVAAGTVTAGMFQPSRVFAPHAASAWGERA
jgi:tRNA pseudouridine55 synthase